MDNNSIRSKAATDKKRKVRNDIIFISLILSVITVAALVMFLTRTEGDTAVVTVDGRIYGEYPLDSDRTVEIKNGDG